MARSIWSGAISFGLVNVPVKLYSAVSRKTVRFNQLNSETGPLGPLMRARRAAGLIPPDADEEDVLVVRGRNPASTRCRSERLDVTM